MKKIGDFLERFSVVAQDSDLKRDIIVGVLNQFGIKTNKKDISIKGNVVITKVSPAKKSELFLKKSKILEELSKNNLTKNLKNIC